MLLALSLGKNWSLPTCVMLHRWLHSVFPCSSSALCIWPTMSILGVKCCCLVPYRIFLNIFPCGWVVISLLSLRSGHVLYGRGSIPDRGRSLSLPIKTLMSKRLGFFYPWLFFFLLLLLLSSSSSSSPLCRVFILIFLTQTMSLRNTVLQLFCCYYSWCLYR